MKKKVFWWDGGVEKLEKTGRKVKLMQITAQGAGVSGVTMCV